MKKWLCMLLCLAVLLVPFGAMAAVRMPEMRGNINDSADILSAQTTNDLADFIKQVTKRADIDLYVATVHFLDGMDVQAYTDQLFAKWELTDEDLLLVGAAERASLVLRRGRKAHAHGVLILRARDPARGVREFVRTVLHVHAADLADLLRIHLTDERPSAPVRLVEIAVHYLWTVRFALDPNGTLHAIVRLQRIKKSFRRISPRLVVALRHFPVDDRLAGKRRFLYFRSVDRAVVHMAKVIVLKGYVLVVPDRRLY